MVTVSPSLTVVSRVSSPLSVTVPSSEFSEETVTLQSFFALKVASMVTLPAGIENVYVPLLFLVRATSLLSVPYLAVMVPSV